MAKTHPKATPKDDALAFFAEQQKTVLTFLGYSGAGYERPDKMLAEAGKVLDRFDPAATIVNIGATTDGIGAVYELATARGFVTTGIVSTEALAADAEISPAVDHVFFVEDATWGGFLEDGETLSPTSELMVAASDVMVTIGGGEVARDEFVAARRIGKTVEFIPADMNYEAALKKARKQGVKGSVQFYGAVSAFLSRQKQ